MDEKKVVPNTSTVKATLLEMLIVARIYAAYKVIDKRKLGPRIMWLTVLLAPL